jgi:DNA-binding NarL/FixJ family response regulator
VCSQAAGGELEIDRKNQPMASSSSGSGGDFLAKKSDLMRARTGMPALKDVLIVEDEDADADRLKATLRVMFGYDIEVRRAATLGAAIDSVMAKSPEFVFLDDVLKPSDEAHQTIPFLRRAGYEGPIVVVSGRINRQRRATLLGAGANDVIHKDDVDSVRLTEALTRVFAAAEAPAPAAAVAAATPKPAGKAGTRPKAGKA